MILAVGDFYRRGDVADEEGRAIAGCEGNVEGPVENDPARLGEIQRDCSRACDHLRVGTCLNSPLVNGEFRAMDYLGGGCLLANHGDDLHRACGANARGRQERIQV